MSTTATSAASSATADQDDVPGVQGFVRMRSEPDHRPHFWTLDHDGPGKVHVLDRFVDGTEHGRINQPFNPWMRARCGLLRREQDAYGIDAFADDRLCARCEAATPEGERSGLYEHPTDDGGSGG